MRTLLRIGGILGGAGFVALYALQTGTALAVAAGIPLIGLLAGLGAAKWLPRDWYGRQFKAGLRAGMLASGLAALGALLSLLLLGPRAIPTLAAHSHLASLTLAPIVQALAFLTWAGVDILLVVVAAALGCALAAVAAQVFAWSKSAEAVRVVQQARLAAQALNHDDAWQPRPTGAPLLGQPVPALGVPSSSNLTGMTSMTGAPALSSMPGPVSAAGATGYIPATGVTPGLGLTAPLTFTPGSGTPLPPFGYSPQQPAPASRPPLPRYGIQSPQSQASAPAPDPEIANATEPVLPAYPARPHTPANPPAAQAPDTAQSGRQRAQARRRSSSSRRRADQELTQAMRDALAAWATESAADGDEATTSDDKATPRAPASSAYLNSVEPSPASKRGRKKQHTRDWLC